ncbi:hypothetical protein D7Y21_39950 [Corallococcus sp. AB045]|nr:hypothetical protein D7Y21_39950 [Corallococcus sp. AB045]
MVGIYCHHHSRPLVHKSVLIGYKFIVEDKILSDPTRALLKCTIVIEDGRLNTRTREPEFLQLQDKQALVLIDISRNWWPGTTEIYRERIRAQLLAKIQDPGVNLGITNGDY